MQIIIQHQPQADTGLPSRALDCPSQNASPAPCSGSSSCTATGTPRGHQQTYLGGKERMSLLLSQGWDATSHAQSCSCCLWERQAEGLGTVQPPQHFCHNLSSKNEEPQYTSYGLSRVQTMTAVLQKHEGVNLQLM